LGQVTIFSGNERRRVWSDEAKRDLVNRAFAPGASVAQVAQAADLHTSLLWRWRRELRGDAAKPGTGFAQLVATPDAPVRDVRVAIRVQVGSVSVDIADHASATLVTATLKALAR
jgi:transposase